MQWVHATRRGLPRSLLHAPHALTLCLASAWCAQNPYAPTAARAFTPPVAFDPPDVGQAFVTAGDADTWQATALDVLCSKGVTHAQYLRVLANPVGLAWSPLLPATGTCFLAVLGSDFRVRLYTAPQGLDFAWQQVQDLAGGLLSRRRQVDWGTGTVRQLDRFCVS